MNAVATKQKLALKKILLIALGVVAALLVLAAAVIGAVWHNEIGSVASIEQLRARNDDHLDGAVYSMHVQGGFYLDEFVAQGGVSNDSELIQFVTDNITRGVVDIQMSAPEIGCSSFTAAAADGDRLFARNYDFSKTNTMLVFTEANEGRHASISTVDLQFLGVDVDQDMQGLMDKVICLAAPYAPLDGINDAGVACGIYMTYQGGEETIPTDQDTDKPDFTSTTLLRLILDYADNVEERLGQHVLPLHGGRRHRQERHSGMDQRHRRHRQRRRPAHAQGHLQRRRQRYRRARGGQRLPGRDQLCAAARLLRRRPGRGQERRRPLRPFV